MTQKDVLRVMGAFTRELEAQGASPQVKEQARKDMAKILKAALDAMQFDGLDVDQVCFRIANGGKDA